MRLPAVIFLAALLCLVASSGAQPPASCQRIPIGEKVFDLSWWIGKGPLTSHDRAGVYTFEFALCTPLSAPCPDTADEGHRGACAAPGSASACQKWSNPQNPVVAHSVCLAAFNGPSSFQAYQGSGGDYGVSVIIRGGDYCAACSPPFRYSVFNVICDRSTEPQIAVEKRYVTDPMYTFTIRHCSGCSRNSPNFCGGSPVGVAEIDLVAKFIPSAANLTNTVALLPPAAPTELKISTYLGDALRVGGTVVNTANSTIDFLANPGLGLSAVARLSFPGTQVVSMVLLDPFTGKASPCSPANMPRGHFVSFTCNFANYGAVSVMGTVL
eukprot:TRINITY_DN2121_c0_g1_i2.p1 TRINITY_DN2121_c0_g1~~TRINITY_DN2121_c0_g1_i2.p1  ORF type:complete len:326 (+),score=39.47 TRINITY_DN2121_c0_g1_i2:333-1310(+)